MGVPLSRPIELFIASENAHDTDALAMCFTTNATVTDEGRTMTGLKGIAATLDFVFDLEGDKIASLEIES
jgi:hypothetical protein